MKIEKTIIEGCFILTPKIFEDFRGYFFVPYNFQDMKEIIGDKVFIQDNQSYSKKGVIRGLHFQSRPFSQTKLVRCTSGKILDVVVDLRKNSKTYGKYISVELNDENRKLILVPNYCAHGFSTLSESAIVEYKVDNTYNPQYENSIIWNDSELNIDWKIPANNQILADKDKLGKTFSSIIF